MGRPKREFEVKTLTAQTPSDIYDYYQKQADRLNMSLSAVVVKTLTEVMRQGSIEKVSWPEMIETEAA